MRIVTYNVWNSAFNWQRRLTAIMEELIALDADVVALQETPTFATPGQLLIDFLREGTRSHTGCTWNTPKSRTRATDRRAWRC